MNWEAIGTIVALLGVTASFVLTLRGQKLQRELDEASASRSEAAARLTEEYTARVVVALETIASAGGVGHGATPSPRVHWTLAHHGGDTYILTNTGTAIAYGVSVAGHESLVGPDRFGDASDLGPGEATTFIAARTLATTDSTVTVRWKPDPQAKDEDRMTWKYPLPARPRR